MSRLIEYKVYVKFLNEMQSATEIYNDGGCMTDCYEYALAHDDVILLQYSGINDSNDRMLYEGDVIKSGTFYWVVRFIDGSFLACLFDKKRTSLTKTLKDREVSLVPCVYTGNIYQNPELLK